MKRFAVGRALAALAVVPALALAGCSSDEPAEKAVEEAVEDAAGGSADVDIDDDSIKIETDEGEVSVGQDLPDDFPSDVALVDGEVVSAMSMAGKGWTVSVQTDQSMEDLSEVADDARARLGDDYDVATTMENDTMSGYVLQGDTYLVTVSASQGEGGALVSYTVAPAE